MKVGTITAISINKSARKPTYNRLIQPKITNYVPNFLIDKQVIYVIAILKIRIEFLTYILNSHFHFS